ncbi:MAG: Asp-tRNA(Asn)/Glu-tRNA(Gln) amidotransferase subunit GatB [Acidobacteria bacterium]|jgi:aspartyl-tRNA(Asn)/glutamyl-tRNA(Gln) amidotransferase subunit B|nr:Asp-tRNA(Asn)/Glu-tRNA(Gln) amidotransferase subunit GatB [Acidobacteriota bacterium]
MTTTGASFSERLAGYEPVIGLEVHAQLLTRTKLFCSCANRFGDPPNTHVCPVCVGLPGALPVLSREAVTLAMKAALATHCTVQSESIWARKNYFYPDLPKGYQISQYEKPLALEGWVEIPSRAGEPRRVRLQRIHMEEDAGKLLHEGFPWSGEQSGVDLNRSGVPLIEMVTHPDLHSPEDAFEYLSALKAILLYTEASDCNMEEGSLRCDANVSVRRRGANALGTRTEIKNLNSFRHVARALEHEIARQVALIESGGEVVQETRLWDSARGETAPMRSKEEAHDYRYFPEPDLAPLRAGDEWIEEVRGTLPELPAERRRRFAGQYDLPDYDAGVLTQSRAVADYFEAVARESGNAKAASNWVMNEVLRKVKEDDVGLEACGVTPQGLGELVGLIEKGTISGRIAKDLFEKMWASGEAPGAIVEREGLAQVSDVGALQATVAEVVAANPEQVAAYRGGKKAAIGWFVGQVMKRTGGKANPRVVNQLLRTALDSDA